MGIFSGQKRIDPVGSILPSSAKNEIMSGRLPHISTDTIFLKKGEFCCYIDKAKLLIDETKRVYGHVGNSSPGLFKKTRFNVGVGIPNEYTNTVEYKAILYITYQRIILYCRDHGFDRQLTRLTSIKGYSNAIELQFGGTTYRIVVPDGNVAYQAIQLASQRRSTY